MTLLDPRDWRWPDDGNEEWPLCWICLALTHIYSKDETISNLPSAMTKLGESFKIGGTAVTYGSLLTLGLFAVAGIASLVLGTMLAPITSLACVLKQIAEKDGAPAEAAEAAAE